MPLDELALAFLDSLERAEQALLAWGLLDGFFREDELETRARALLQQPSNAQFSTNYASESDLVQALCDEGLLWRLPDLGSAHDSVRYRTRFAESVRLFACLRQTFDDSHRSAWRTAPRLVADFRLVRSPRIFPRRDVPASALLAAITKRTNLSSLQADVVSALVGGGLSRELQLADFQARATSRILAALTERRLSGTVVCSGTGSGKTLAFFLPAYVAIAQSLDQAYWTRCMAVYPRKELLKDQLREAITNARRMAPVLRRHNRRRLVLAALFGDTPQSHDDLEGRWQHHNYRGRTAFRCPYVICPECGGAMLWTNDDAQQGIERLVCANRSCDGQLESDEIRLTRVRMLDSPPDILFTTTEMLNQRLSSSRYSRVFGLNMAAERRPKLVLVDEVHSYDGPHGAHVAYLLRRWRHLSRARPHFVGLSATLADATRFFSELTGIGIGDISEIAPGVDDLHHEGAEYQLALRGNPTSGASLLSTTIQTAMLLSRVLSPDSDNPYFGSKVFTFTDNLDAVNRLYHDLLDAEGRTAFGQPSRRSLGSLANLRASTNPAAFERFNVGQNWVLVEDMGHSLADGERGRVGRTTSQDPGVAADADIIVATSSLEVGFDDPEVGAVLQHKAPQTAAAFLQRKGRAGRRRSTRPWTVVVLSDWGRDRLAYQSYERLFSPILEPHSLPLSNPSILKAQATYALFDWLATKTPAGQRVDPWRDLAGPAEPNGQRAHRWAIYMSWLRRLLEDRNVRDDFAAYLQRALSVSPDVVSALLWEAPRSLLMEAVPTLLRRLETNFSLAGRAGHDLYTSEGPLPDFVPRNLFLDLQLPEVAVRLPAYRGGSERSALMPIAQALAEFAPGRVSRRFGLTDARERHWVALNLDGTTSIDISEFCPPAEREELGQYRFSEAETETRIRVFRPHALLVTLPPADVGSSSNAILEWRTELVPSGEGHTVDVPSGTQWAQVIRSVRFHTHHLITSIEARRFTIGVRANVVRDRTRRVERRCTFVAQRNGAQERVGLGFSGDVDAIELQIRYPAPLYSLCPRDSRLLRGLRIARFRALIAEAPELDGIANPFQREWLAQTYVAAITTHALRLNCTVENAEADVFTGSSTMSPSDLATTILDWGDDGGDDNDGDGQSPPRRLQEFKDLLHRQDVLDVLHRAARVLTVLPDGQWEAWLRKRFKATLGAAFADAARAVLPETDPDALFVEVDGLPELENSESDALSDSVWLTEATVGGGGIVESLLSAYAEDPRRFFSFVDSALGPSDLETVASDLEFIVDHVASEDPSSDDVRKVFATLRAADSYAVKATTLADIRVRLTERGVLPNPPLLIALNTRVLGPGTNESTDRLIARIIGAWDEAERRLGVDVDARILALVHSRETALERALGVAPEGGTEEARASWRYGILYGMLWPRGAELRAQMMRANNPFAPWIDCDRLLVRVAVPHAIRSVPLSDASWYEVVAQILTEDGTVELVASIEEARQLASALRRFSAEPIDAGDILVHARMSAIHRDATHWRAVLELPEVLQ